MPYGQQTAEYGMGGPGRDRITAALMEVQNPAPTADVPPVPPPPPSPPPGMPGGAPGGGAGAPGGGMPPAATGTPGMGVPPMLPQLGTAIPPGMQPGGMLAPQAPPGGMPPR
jgi:hypothetical protein